MIEPCALLLPLVSLSAALVGPGDGELPLAVGGLDPVRLVAGSEEPGREGLWAEDGYYRYRFTGLDTLLRFWERPGRYGVQARGSCAGMGADLRAGGSRPELYQVYRGRLFLFAGEGCLEEFLAEPDRFVEAIDAGVAATWDVEARGELASPPDTEDWRPSWSPDGERIVFSSRRTGNWDLFSVDPDGGHLVQLTTHEADDWRPKWSPDGSRISFASRRDGNWEIYVMNADGSNPTRLTHDEAEEQRTAWAPDGARLAFDSERDGQDELYVMDADGGNVQRLTFDDAFDGYPAWSPDGSRIAFTSGRGGDREIWVMNADGSEPRRLTESPGLDQAPDWSPDGTRIAWFSQRNGFADVYSMAADGSDVVRHTSDPGHDFMPAWSPDGTRLAYDSSHDGRRGLWVLDLARGATSKLTNPQVTPFVVLAEGRGVDLAVETYANALERGPAGRPFGLWELNRLAGRLFERGDAGGGLKVAQLAAGAFPDDPEAYVLLGSAYGLAGAEEARDAAFACGAGLAGGGEAWERLVESQALRD